MSQLPSIPRALREFGVEAKRGRRAWHSTNQKYRVTSVGGSVFGLRVGGPWWPTHRRARSICTWVASLGEAGFVVPAPLRTTGGDWIAAFSDEDDAELACTLEAWLPAWGAYAYDLGYICELLGPALETPLLEAYASVARLPVGLPVMRAGFSIKVMGARAALPHGSDVVRTRVKRLAELDARLRRTPWAEAGGGRA